MADVCTRALAGRRRQLLDWVVPKLFEHDGGPLHLSRAQLAAEPDLDFPSAGMARKALDGVKKLGLAWLRFDSRQGRGTEVALVPAALPLPGSSGPPPGASERQEDQPPATRALGYDAAHGANEAAPDDPGEPRPRRWAWSDSAHPVPLGKNAEPAEVGRFLHWLHTDSGTPSPTPPVPRAWEPEVGQFVAELTEAEGGGIERRLLMRVADYELLQPTAYDTGAAEMLDALPVGSLVEVSIAKYGGRDGKPRRFSQLYRRDEPGWRYLGERPGWDLLAERGASRRDARAAGNDPSLGGRARRWRPI